MYYIILYIGLSIRIKRRLISPLISNHWCHNVEGHLLPSARINVLNVQFTQRLSIRLVSLTTSSSSAM